MTEPRQSNPTPSAVPWTPDMMVPQSAAPQPLQHAQTPPPLLQPTQQHPALPQEFEQPRASQSYVQQMQMHPPQPRAPQQLTQAQMGQPHYLQNNQPIQPVPHHQMVQPQYAPPQFAQTAPAPQFSQPVTPPPLAPHMQATQQESPQVIEAERESKSLFAKLLKRSPNPKASTEVQTPAGGSGSLFNKNFVLGAVTGLVIGAFVLPMALNMIGGDAPVQTQAHLGQSSMAEITPTASEGNTFIDSAISSDAP